MSDDDGDEPSKVVVCDNGTGFVKCGYAGENFPRHAFQSMVGRPMLRAEDAEMDSKVKLKDVMIGDEAAAARQFLEIKYPLENGTIKDWGDMELLWKHTFRDVMGICKVDGDNYDCSSWKAFLTEAPGNADGNRAQMLQMMFEVFRFDAVTVQTQAMLTLYAQGLTTGVVLDSGDGVTHAVGVYQGYVLKNLTQRLDLAGRTVTRYLCDLLRRRGYSLNSTADLETVREIKEELCFTAYDIEEARKFARETTVLLKDYKLPDGSCCLPFRLCVGQKQFSAGQSRGGVRTTRSVVWWATNKCKPCPVHPTNNALAASLRVTTGSVVKLGGERFEAAEAMFDPDLVDVSQPGAAHMLHNLVEGAEIDLRMSLYSHIVLSGGSTMYPGFPTRLEKELTSLYLQNVLGGNKRGLRVRFGCRRRHRRRRSSSLLSSSSYSLSSSSAGHPSRRESGRSSGRPTWEGGVHSHGGERVRADVQWRSAVHAPYVVAAENSGGQWRRFAAVSASRFLRPRPAVKLHGHAHVVSLRAHLRFVL
jgi:actin-related protein 2